MEPRFLQSLVVFHCCTNDAHSLEISQFIFPKNPLEMRPSSWQLPAKKAGKAAASGADALPGHPIPKNQAVIDTAYH